MINDAALITLRGGSHASGVTLGSKCREGEGMSQILSAGINLGTLVNMTPALVPIGSLT